MQKDNIFQTNRRSFLKVSGILSGGLVLGFTWGSCTRPEDIIVMPKEWYDINGYLKIGENGLVTIMSPNPEIGQNVKTSMPMIIAEELDCLWKNVIVEQGALNTDVFSRQVAGGSQSLRAGWTSLRTAGATARKMLVNAAAQQWEVDPSTLKTEEGFVVKETGEKLSYGDLAMAASKGEPVKSEDVQLKDPKDFKIIGTETSNVDLENIVTGKPLFGIDTKKEGMAYASVMRPPSFGQKLVSFNDADARSVSGVKDVFQFGDKIAVIADSNWSAMKAKKALKAEWTDEGTLENTEAHDAQLLALLNTKSETPKRKDGDVDKAFAEADEILERIYEAPFLPHNCLEPMNFFAHVTDDKVDLLGPIQTPQWTRGNVAKLLNRPEEQVSVDMTRMGGGFGRRLYGDFAEEAAEISSIAKMPIQLQFTREDDMTAGTYRPASKYKFKAAIKEGKLTGYHLVGAGVNMGNSTREDNFPASAVENYLVESHELKSNITTGAWRAPITNFLAFAEQAFFDELATKIGKDPVEFRLELFERAKNNPVGKLDYDPEKSIGVIKLAAEKSNWGTKIDGVYQGFSAYYSHNTYVAEVANVVLENGNPRVTNVVCAIDCGIVVNPLGAKNQVEGGVVDGIGHAMFGDFSFKNGRANHENFGTYKMIRMSDAPAVEAHFVKNTNDPTGLGEPTLPPAGGALANAFAAAGRERLYKQPFIQQIKIVG